MQFSFLGANSFTEIHNGKDARVNGIETRRQLHPRRPDAERARQPTPTPRRRGTSATSLPTPRLTAATDGDFITAPSGTRLPVTPKFKAQCDGALHMARVGRCPRARARRCELSGLRAIVAADCYAAVRHTGRYHGRMRGSRCARAERFGPGAVRPEQVPGEAAIGDFGRSLCGPGFCRDGASRPSRPTYSTSAMSSAASSGAAAARALWSCPAARAPSGFAQG